MKLSVLSVCLLFSSCLFCQGPAITSWLQNTSQTGSYYMNGNGTPISNGIPVNCQQVEYSNDFVYVTTEGVPSYPTGPFLDGNPSQAQAQGAIYKIPLNPQPNNGNPTSTTMGTIGIFINGTSLYDYRDGVAWNPSTNALCGGPGNPPCPGGPAALMDWNRDAIPAEMDGFDCSKGHPAMGQYHHHQNPSAFDLDLNVVSSICNLYDAEGLYAIDPSTHSPLIGYAYDGYPIYGAYGYANQDGSGGIVRIKSSYQLQNLSSRTNGPAINTTYFLGYFREDYEYVSQSGEDFLDEHNGRVCVTPEYPNGTYAYFCTVDENHNSYYPYAVGPTFYGVYSNAYVNSINEGTTIYSPSVGIDESIEQLHFDVFPNPGMDLLAIQANGLVRSPLEVKLLTSSGLLVFETSIFPGQTIAYFDLQTLTKGIYIVNINTGKSHKTFRVVHN
ncbi:YHYH protein [Crocinitomicaceae bacterium]|nr:YHYH protein [Crocinitomicaceae bacterium]